MSVDAAVPYGEDLAYIQAAGFGWMAAAVAPQIIELLRSRNIVSGTLGDIGCGAGVTTSAFLNAGYRVWALEPSPALLDIARATAPRAEFLPPRCVYKSELQPADAIVAIGEPLNYHPLHSNADGHVERFFSQAAAALRARGVLVFDVIVRGQPPLTARTWSAGDDWAVLAEVREDIGAGWLERDIHTFRRVDGVWRRGRETHHVRVFDAAALASALHRCGFDVQIAAAYGSCQLAARRAAFICELPSLRALSDGIS